jgi:hypothetical protein
MARTFTPAQSAYLIARAAYDVARDEAHAVDLAYDALCDRMEASLTPAEYDAWRADRRNDGPNPILVAQSRALDTLRAAERALIDQTIDKVSHLAKSPEQKAALATMRTVKPWQVKAYDGVIDLAMRFDGVA